MSSADDKLESDFKKLGDRLIAAGWATGFLITTDNLGLDLTQKGRRRIKQLYNVLHDLGDGGISPGEISSLRAVAVWMHSKRRKSKPL